MKLFGYRFKEKERQLRQRENLLQWIEQQRGVMAAEQTTFASRVGPKNVTENPAPGQRKRGRKARSLLPSGVSKKCSPKHKCLRPRTRDVPSAAESARADSSAPRGSSLRIPNQPEKKARCENERTPLYAFRPQRAQKLPRKHPWASHPPTSTRDLNQQSDSKPGEKKIPQTEHDVNNRSECSRLCLVRRRHGVDEYQRDLIGFVPASVLLPSKL